MLDAPKPGADIVSEAEIEAVVRLFYGRVRADARLGPIFAGAIGDDWEPHLQTMFQFWSSMLRGTGRYNGRPMPKHVALRPQVKPDDFLIWLDLFRAAAREASNPEAASLFIARAERIADSFSSTMFFDPAAIAPKRPAPKA